MALWLSENIGTIGVSLVLILIVALIIRGMIRDKKKGKSSCGCKCSHCPMSASCRKTLPMRKAENRGRERMSGSYRIIQ